MVSRNDQIGAGGTGLEDPSGEVESRYMARAEKTGITTQRRHASLVRTQSDGDKDFRPQRAMPVAAGSGLQGVP